MESKPLWELFCQTGDPMLFVLYRSAEEQESGGAQG